MSRDDRGWNIGRVFRNLFDDAVAEELAFLIPIALTQVVRDFHGQVMERDRAPNQKQQRHRQHQEPVIEGVVDECADHCSTVFCKTSALVTTCWPG